MAHTNNRNRHHQSWGVPRPEESSLLGEASPEETMASQLERVAAALNKLEARLEASILRGGAAQAMPHPISAPPFGAPGVASVSYPRPEPDPPDEPLLYATAQPPYAPYELPLPPYQPYTWQQPSSSDLYMHLYPQGQLLATQPRQPTSWDLPAQCQHQSHPTFNRLPPRSPTCWDPPWYRVQQGHQLYDQQSPSAWPSACWDTPGQHTPEGYPAYDQPLPHGWCPLNHQHSTIYPSKFNDLVSGFASIGEGRSEFIGYSNEYWDSDDQWDAADSRCLSPLHLHHVPSTRSPPTAAAIPPPPASISLSCSPDIRYGSVKLFIDDFDELVQSRQIHYDDIVFEQLLHRDENVEEDVLLNGEEVLLVANDIQLDTEFLDVIAHANEAIHSGVEGSLTLSNVEASKQLIEEDVDKVWTNTDTIGKQSKVGESIIPIDKNLIMDMTNSGQDAPSNMVISNGGDDAIISHRSTMLNADARLIPPRSDTPCLGIHGRVDEPPVLALNNHKHNRGAGQVEEVDKVLQAYKSAIYQASIEPRSRTRRQKPVLLTPDQSRSAIQRRKAAKLDCSLRQVYETGQPSRNWDEALEDSIYISDKFLEMGNSYSSMRSLHYDIFVEVALGVKWISEVGFKNLKVVGLQLGDVAILDILAALIVQDELTTQSIRSDESRFQFDPGDDDKALPAFLSHRDIARARIQ